jgi:hypothetical protein
LLDLELGNIDELYPSWSPNGQIIACTVFFSSSNAIYDCKPDGSNARQVFADPNASGFYPSWSPDGRQIAFTRTSGGSTTWVCDAVGGNAHQINGLNGVQPCWSPPRKTSVLVGSGGTMGTTAAGFIYGQTTAGVNGIVTFNGVAPDSVTVTTNDQSIPSQILVFQIDGGLNKLVYQNQYAVPVSVLPGGGLSTASSALVSFDALNGAVASVMPINAARGKMTSSHQGNSVVYQADFLGVFDSKGHNSAPNGCRSVRVEAGSGLASVIQ